MSTIDDLQQLYFLSSAEDISYDGDQILNRPRAQVWTPDTTGQGMPREPPVIHSNNDIRFFIDGNEYFQAIFEEFDSARAVGRSNPFFYFTGWWLQLVNPGFVTNPDELADDPTGRPVRPVIDTLADMATHNVDVRAFPWISRYFYNRVPRMTWYAERTAHSPDPGALGNLVPLSKDGLQSVAALRAHPALTKRVVINTLSHPLGSMHLKLVVCGDDSSVRAYTSGIEFAASRNLSQFHDDVPSGNDWHDVGVRVDGPAAAQVYQHVRSLWNTQLQLDPFPFRLPGVPIILSHLTRGSDASEAIPDRTWPAPTAGGTRTHRVQVLRTLPQMNAGVLHPLRYTRERHSQTIPLYAAHYVMRERTRLTTDRGLFEFMPALRKAISVAVNYIYIEDQACTSFDVMAWIRSAVMASPTLKAIFLAGPDPSDPASGTFAEANRRYLFGIDPASDAAPVRQPWWDQIAFYHRRGRTVHAKVTIIDDAWVAVGSANCMRRSLYTDGELSLGILDEAAAAPGAAISAGSIRDLRCRLWAEQCAGFASGTKGPYEARLRAAALEDALCIWSPPGSGHPWPGRPPEGLQLPAVDGGRGMERFSPVARGEHPYDVIEHDVVDSDSTQVF